MKEIILTGGGIAGHVTPNIALPPILCEASYEILYVGLYKGVEHRLIETTGTPYCGISSGKLCRCSDWKNFADPFRVLKGYGETKAILRGFRPGLIFSKGGCIAVPVVRAARRLGIPAVIHESDMTPGLTNRLSYSVATRICCNSPETLSLLPKSKAVLTGSSIRAKFLSGSREATYERTGFAPKRPVFLVIGSGLGSCAVNVSVREALPNLLKEFQVLHIADKNNLDPTLSETPGYRQLEYVFEELKDCFTFVDIMVNCASVNATCEILALRKPNVLILLSAKVSRGDQIPNTRSYEKQGYSRVFGEEALSRETLLAAVWGTCADRVRYLAAMEAGGSADDATQVMSTLNSVTAGRR